MKVVKRGNLPELEVCKGTCRNCKSELEALRGELKVTNDQRDGTMMSGSCPVCNRQVWFNPTKQYETDSNERRTNQMSDEEYWSGQR